MKESLLIHLMTVIMTGFLVFNVSPDFPRQAMEVQIPAQAGNHADPEFLAMLAKLDAAQLELQNGRPAAFKALWSRRDDITLSGGFGGTIEKGWEQINRRLDWVGTQFSKGTNTIERVVVNSGGDLGYVVQIEHLRFHVPGRADESTRDYRVTMVFRREAEGWRIVHRQADSQMTKESIR
jgi:ketosteroid isomerase-like protein